MPLTREKILKLEYMEVSMLKRRIAPDEIQIRYEPRNRKDLALLKSHLKRITPKINSHDYIRDHQVENFGWTENISTALFIATIAIVVGKGLLDGFLKEFGGDGAKALKGTLKTLFEKERSQFITIFPKGVPIVEKQLRTPILSLTLFLGVGDVKAKFDFPVRLSKSEVSKAMQLLPEVVMSAQRIAKKKRKKSGILKFKYNENKWSMLETSRTTKKRRSTLKKKFYG